MRKDAESAGLVGKEGGALRGLGGRKGTRRKSEDRSTVSGASAEDGSGASASGTRKKREGDLLAEATKAGAGTLHPQEMVLRLIGEMWAKKLVEDNQMDTRGKPRMAMRQFMREFFLRQYGVRAIGIKAIGDFAFSLRHYLQVKSHLERARIENRARLELFASMCGLHSEGEQSWRARKVNFFLLFLQAVVGREALPAQSKGDGVGGKQGVKIEAIRERLTKRRTLARVSSVTFELARFVSDATTRTALLERAQQSSFVDEGGSSSKQRGGANLAGPSSATVDLDAFLVSMMQTWEDTEMRIEKRRVSRLYEIVRSRVGGGDVGAEAEEERASDLMISYDEFELIIRDIRQAGGVEADEG